MSKEYGYFGNGLSGYQQYMAAFKRSFEEICASDGFDAGEEDGPEEFGVCEQADLDGYTLCEGDLVGPALSEGDLIGPGLSEDDLVGPALSEDDLMGPALGPDDLVGDEVCMDGLIGDCGGLL